MLEDVKKDKLVYGGGCLELKVRLNSAFLFFNTAVMREYFSKSGVDSARVQYDTGKKVLVIIPCKSVVENSFKVGRVEKGGRVRSGYLPIKRIAATYGFKELLNNESVAVRGGDGVFGVPLVETK